MKSVISNRTFDGKLRTQIEYFCETAKIAAPEFVGVGSEYQLRASAQDYPAIVKAIAVFEKANVKRDAIGTRRRRLDEADDEICHREEIALARLARRYQKEHRKPVRRAHASSKIPDRGVRPAL